MRNALGGVGSVSEGAVGGKALSRVVVQLPMPGFRARARADFLSAVGRPLRG